MPYATTTLTVAEYMSYWLEHIAKPSIRRATYATYKGYVRLHVVPGIGNRKLKSLQAAHIRAWLTGLQTRCQCCMQGKDAARACTSKARCCVLWLRLNAAMMCCRRARSDKSCAF
ncbi:MAG: N-terminal phage integrase SAM-like domain-containing protein [Mycobacterium sp.]|uniref:N-terminal phage integrase SAM-like domain-containing protein n=1 Tax=Mycobacterium sp. TaxID=1785 RepID=UPI003F9C7EF6